MIENTDSDQSEPIKYKGQVHYKLTSFRKPRPDFIQCFYYEQQSTNRETDNINCIRNFEVNL